MNQFPSCLLDRTVKHYRSNFFASTSRTFAATSSNESRTHYYKLPFVGPFSTYAQRRIKQFTRRYCKNLDIKFLPHTMINNLFSAKDAFLNYRSRSRDAYKFSCAGLSACYVGETNRHLATRIREHLTSDKNPHIFQHIYGSETCRALCSGNCFSILDTGGYSIYPWVGRCGPAPHTLTVFKANITDFPTLLKTELRFLIPCLRHLKLRLKEVVWFSCCVINGKLLCLVSMPKSTEANVN